MSGLSLLTSLVADMYAQDFERHYIENPREMEINIKIRSNFASFFSRKINKYKITVVKKRKKDNIFNSFRTFKIVERDFSFFDFTLMDVEEENRTYYADAGDFLVVLNLQEDKDEERYLTVSPTHFDIIDKYLNKPEEYAKLLEECKNKKKESE